MPVAARWTVLLLATVAAGALLEIVGIPSPYLFAALLVGLGAALVVDAPLSLPGPAFVAAQALLGVVLGLQLKTSSLEAIAHSWLPVTIVSLGTLAVCVGAGWVLTRMTRLDAPTATLGMVAGGASGIVAMADEIGADDRLVAFMQYFRVLIVVLATPVLAALFFPGAEGGGSAPGVPLLGEPRDWLLTLAIAPVGILAGRLVRLPAAALLGPMLVAGAIALAEPFDRFVVPELLQQAGFILIGVQVGLKFTPATVREVGRLLGPVFVSIVALMAACFGLAVLLDALSSVTLLDAYLATTPGGLYAVVAVAFGAGANSTFILAVQSLRLFVMILLAPMVVRRLVRPR